MGHIPRRASKGSTGWRKAGQFQVLLRQQQERLPLEPAPYRHHCRHRASRRQARRQAIIAKCLTMTRATQAAALVAEDAATACEMHCLAQVPSWGSETCFSGGENERKNAG
jgi:hypothetical protein